MAADNHTHSCYRPRGSKRKWVVMRTKHLHTPGKDLHISSRGAPGSEFWPLLAAVLDATRIRRLLHRSVWTYLTFNSPSHNWACLTWTDREVPHRSRFSAYSTGVDGAVERQSGPGDRSLGGDWSGCGPGTGPARHEGCRLRQECR